MIEYMETELTEASEINSKNENSAVTIQANVDEAITAEAKAINDEAIPIYLQKELKTKSYKKTMKIDIENITTS